MKSSIVCLEQGTFWDGLKQNKTDLSVQENDQLCLMEYFPSWPWMSEAVSVMGSRGTCSLQIPSEMLPQLLLILLDMSLGKNGLWTLSPVCGLSLLYPWASPYIFTHVAKTAILPPSTLPSFFTFCTVLCCFPGCCILRSTGQKTPASVY